MGWVSTDADTRQTNVETAIREAFTDFIETRDVDVVVFSGMTALNLA
jgi:hypothetical protein